MILQDKENTIGFLLSRSTNVLWRELNRNFVREGFHVTPEQFSVMMKLYHIGDLNQKDLAEHTCKDKVSITKIVKLLEKNGLVTRTFDLNDKRIRRISLTGKARKIMPKLHNIAYTTVNNSIEDCEKSDVEVFKKVLRNIYHNLSV